MKGGYLLYNGKFHKEGDPLFSGHDSIYSWYGVRELFRTEDNQILFADSNYTSICFACNSLDIPLPADFDPSGARLMKDVSRLLNKNKFYLAAQVTVHLFLRKGGTGYLLVAKEVPRGYYPLEDRGLLLDFYGKVRKSDTVYSSFEVGSRFIWGLARGDAERRSKDNMVLFNEKGYACECIETSFAVIKDRNVYLPSVSACGYYPALMSAVKKSVLQSGFNLCEEEGIKANALLNADEMFLISNSLGIQKVLGLGERRYYSDKTAHIAGKLREIAVSTHRTT